MAIVSNEDVAAKVRGRAAEARITHSQIAESLRLSPMAISRRINGRTPFTPNELSTLADLLGVSVASFFGEQRALVGRDAA